MKKAIGILVLGLLLTSCSDLKVKKALENCANQKFLTSNERDSVIPITIDDHEEYQAYKKRIDSLEYDAQQLRFDRESAHEKYKKENLMPIFSKEDKLKEIGESPEAGDPDFTTKFMEWTKKELEYTQNLSRRQDKYFAGLNKIRTEFNAKISKVNKKIRAYQYGQKKIRLGLVDEKFKKMDFKQKSKISLYIKLYGSCEKEHKELPKQFLMKYQN
jgi:hypothetical protein